MSLRRKRRRRPTRGILACALVVAAVWVWRSVPLGRQSEAVSRRAPAEAQRPVRPASMRGERRPVHPYTVLRGGVWSGEELAGRLADDPVVAAHYRGFRTARARLERVTRPRRALVS